MQNLDIFSTDEVLALAELDLEREKFEDGLYKLKHLSQQGVINDELDAMLGSTYAKLKLFNSSAEHYGRLLERNDTRLHERFQFGMVNYELGNNDVAIKCWDRVLETEPFYPPVLFHKALLLLELDQVEDASRLLNTLLSSVEETNYYAEQATNIVKELDTLSARTERNQQLVEVH
ncbi:tetratricopeptide repeat protein [Vibrio vulnificus]|nr:hypothetical protein [Vibrio vulnificus]EJP4175447.1 hypothetical protein [Vibrio vulnificus]ELX4197039.1 hypothetical protein [Vibrio vulnificus]